MEYVGKKETSAASDSCIFCEISSQPESDSGAFVVARSSSCLAVLNRYPYTFGHTMVVPVAHISTPEELPNATLTDLSVMANRIMRVLRTVADAPAFNIGANIGAAAGAGIASHYHFHVVPRWPGDANFMVTVGGTQTVPDTLANIHERMQTGWMELFGPPGG